MTIEEAGRVTLILENHRSEPAVLEKGQVLGRVQELNRIIEKPEDIPAATELPDANQVNAFLPPPVAESKTTQADKSKQISETLDHSGERADLSDGELEQLRSLVMEYGMFALSPFELGHTSVVEHTIDTGDHPPIRQPPCRIPHAL